MAKYCNGCKHSEFMAGIENSLAKIIGVPPHPYPTHTCKALNVTRRREKYEVTRLKQCVNLYEPER